ncbi:hypothetical protein V1478_007204 [Vespula squamosa]|uniref:Uncharacterized protein n=1 Tax=Vespula squamosa TaxID=30214 RepID=A0ABD2B2I1_VESSQ
MASVRGKRDNFKSTLAASFPGPGSDLLESLRAWQREYRTIFKRDVMVGCWKSYEKKTVREEFVRREKYRKFVRLTVNFKEEDGRSRRKRRRRRSRRSRSRSRRQRNDRRSYNQERLKPRSCVLRCSSNWE